MWNHIFKNSTLSFKNNTIKWPTGAEEDPHRTKFIYFYQSVRQFVFLGCPKKGPNGLAWFMNGSSKTDPQKLLQSYVKKLGVKHLVQGHQYGKVKFPDNKDRAEEDFFQRYGLLFLIDSLSINPLTK